MTIKCPTCTTEMKENGNTFYCPSCGKTTEIPKNPKLLNYPDKNNIVKSTAYVIGTVGRAVDDSMASQADINLLMRELKDREARLLVHQYNIAALRNAGMIGVQLDEDTNLKVKEHLLNGAKLKYQDALRKIEYEIQSLLSRREDILNDLACIERGELPSE